MVAMGNPLSDSCKVLSSWSKRPTNCSSACLRTFSRLLFPCDSRWMSPITTLPFPHLFPAVRAIYQNSGGGSRAFQKFPPPRIGALTEYSDENFCRGGKDQARGGRGGDRLSRLTGG